jgi:hypothetical protein
MPLVLAADSARSTLFRGIEFMIALGFRVQGVYFTLFPTPNHIAIYLNDSVITQ